MTGGAGGAAGNDGVPVLQGLGGGSATGILFPSLTCFGARWVDSTRSEPPESCSCSGSVFLVLGPVFRGPLLASPENSVHISVHMNVDRNTDRLFQTIWTNESLPNSALMSDSRMMGRDSGPTGH